MFKRANKITSLLLAAAAVVSVIPSSASATTTKVKSQSGQIYNAIAYKDGRFYIGGEPYKKDDAAYYLNNSNYTKLSDINSDDKAEIYGINYVEVENGDYYVDLSNGKVSDDKVKEDQLDSVAVSLRSNVKSNNSGRYDDTDAKTVKDLTELPKAKFSDGWYVTQYKAKTADADTNGGAAAFNVYTDKSGKYIDADYNLGKIKVKLSSGEIALVQNTSDVDHNVRGQVASAKVIGEDSNNIYRLATITVKSTNSGSTIKEINGITISSDTTIFSSNDNGVNVSFNVIQVISKSQASGNIDGIKYAQTVYDYMIADKNGKKTDLLGENENNFTVAGGKLINYEVSGNSLEAQVINLQQKSSYYYVNLGDSDSVTLEDGDNSVDIDSSGNLWAVCDDAIYQFDNNRHFQSIYTVDDTYNNISVYDKNNMVVWNSSDEIYSIIGNSSSTTDTSNASGSTGGSTGTNNNTNTTTPSTNNTVKAGWALTNGSWSYNNADGTKFKGWLNSSGTWYYLDTNGVMATGWKNINGQWYFLTSSGAMKTGWLNDNGTWYYLSLSGAMLSNTTIDGYKLGPSGAWIK